MHTNLKYLLSEFKKKFADPYIGTLQINFKDSEINFLNQIKVLWKPLRHSVFSVLSLLSHHPLARSGRHPLIHLTYLTDCHGQSTVDTMIQTVAGSVLVLTFC